MVRNVCKARGGDNDCLLCNLCNDHSVSVKGTKFVGKNQCLLPYHYVLCSAKFVNSFLNSYCFRETEISPQNVFNKSFFAYFFLTLQNEVTASIGIFKIQI
jgi:hypothetical protein